MFTVRRYESAKRLLDVAVSATALATLAPVMGAVAAAVRTQMGSPILFRQTRPGKNGRPFDMIKFRTMKAPAPGQGPESDGQRLTSLGRFLRSTSLDELPTFWNVLRGDMSLVGPRPLLVEYLDRYTTEQARRHEVKGGITSWAQIHGRNSLDWDDKLSLDVWYVNHRSLWLDLRILAQTVGLVLSRSGINAPGHATAPVFRGSDRDQVPVDPPA